MGLVLILTMSMSLSMRMRMCVCMFIYFVKLILMMICDGRRRRNRLFVVVDRSCVCWSVCWYLVSDVWVIILNVVMGLLCFSVMLQLGQYIIENVVNLLFIIFGLTFIFFVNASITMITATSLLTTHTISYIIIIKTKITIATISFKPSSILHILLSTIIIMF